MKTALLLIAHGSRHAEANADLFHVVEQLRGRYDIVAASFLELCPPTIEEAGRQCVAQGAQRVLMVPYFLSAGLIRALARMTEKQLQCFLLPAFSAWAPG